MSIPTTSLPDSRNGITSSGRGSPGFRTAELATEPLHRIPSLFQRRPDHTTERAERLRPTARLGALRPLPRDACRPQRPLPRIVRGRDRRIVQKPHQVATLVVPSQFVEQPLIVRVAQGPRPQSDGSRPPSTPHPGGGTPPSRPSRHGTRATAPTPPPATPSAGGQTSRLSRPDVPTPG